MLFYSYFKTLVGKEVRCNMSHIPYLRGCSAAHVSTAPWRRGRTHPRHMARHANAGDSGAQK